MDLAPAFDFLRRLAKNNDREWFEKNRAKYEAARGAWTVVVEQLLNGVAEIDHSLGLLEAKDCQFRIYRDVRFSKDKSPYKTNFSGWFCAEGRNANGPGWYVQFQPGKSFVAAGLYMPEREELARYRERVAADAGRLRAILASKSFRKFFPGLTGETVTRVRGYAPDHPAMDLLRYKNLVTSSPFTDDQVLAKDFVRKTLGAFQAAAPFNAWLRELKSRKPGAPALHPLKW
jgi:uncharacterized protein (TIGR02453 family)